MEPDMSKIGRVLAFEKGLVWWVPRIDCTMMMI